MKNILALVVLMGMLGLAVPQAYPQQPGVSRPIVSDLHHVWYCSYYDSISLDNLARFHYLGFSDNAPAEQVTEEVIQAVGIPVTSIAVRPGNVPNAVALVDGTVRVIVYNPGFLHGARTQSGTNWAVYCVMAHEIGHHLSGHTLEPGGSRPDKELEADRFSGHVRFFLNARVDQAMSALQSLPDGGGSATHPPKRDRLQAVVAGWNEAKRRSNGQRNKVTTPLPRELFASNLGVYYTPVPYSDGTFGAGLTRPPAAGSPRVPDRARARRRHRGARRDAAPRPGRLPEARRPDQDDADRSPDRPRALRVSVPRDPGASPAPRPAPRDPAGAGRWAGRG